MRRIVVGAFLAVSVLGVLATARSSWSEETNPGLAIGCGKKCSTFPGNGSFHTAIPGGTFVITVAHLAPGPEDALVRTKPRTCEPIRFRVDTLTAKAADGSVAVALGERKQLGAGQSARIVHSVTPGSSNAPTIDLDQVGFRVRADPASTYCRVVASGLFFPEPTSTSPIPFELLPGATR